MQSPLLTSEIKFDKQIDIPNPKLQSDGSLTYTFISKLILFQYEYLFCYNYNND